MSADVLIQGENANRSIPVEANCLQGDVLVVLQSTGGNVLVQFQCTYGNVPVDPDSTQSDIIINSQSMFSGELIGLDYDLFVRHVLTLSQFCHQCVHLNGHIGTILLKFLHGVFFQFLVHLPRCIFVEVVDPHCVVTMLIIERLPMLLQQDVGFNGFVKS